MPIKLFIFPQLIVCLETRGKARNCVRDAETITINFLKSHKKKHRKPHLKHGTKHAVQQEF